MSYNYIDPSKADAKKRRSTAASGIFSIIIGCLFLAGGIFFLCALKSIGGLIVMLIFALVFIGAGFYFFRQPKIQEQRSAAMDDPNSRIYQKRQAELAKSREKYEKAAENHGSLKSVLCRRTALVYGIGTLLFWALSAIFFLIGIFFPLLVIMDVLCPIILISALFGRQYRKIMQEYALLGVDRAEAEQDFAESRAYLLSTDVLAVSRRFFVASAANIVLPTDQVVWTFSGYRNEDVYKSGMYSHTKRTYLLIIGLSNGDLYQFLCPEELCSLIISDLCSAGVSVQSGYSDALLDLFRKNPDQFRNTEKTGFSVQKEPVLLDKF